MTHALVVFAKAPVAGAAKTRLIPALGAEGAALLAERLLRHTLQMAGSLPWQHRSLCVTPDPAHPAFARALADAAGSWQLALQGNGDLGMRMDRALTRSIAAYGRAVLIGTDAPALDAGMLCAADAALDDHDAVFVPALDGGYALVGLRRPLPALFAGMAWSTPTVMAETRHRLQQAGVRWRELPPVADVDEPADLVHLPDSWR